MLQNSMRSSENDRPHMIQQSSSMIDGDKNWSDFFDEAEGTPDQRKSGGFGKVSTYFIQ